MRALACLLLGLLPALPAPASEPPVRVGYLEFPPFSYVDEGEQARGSMLDFAKRLAEQADLRLELTPYPPARLYHNLASGNTELSLGAIGNPALAGHVLTGKERLGWIDLKLYHRADQPAPNLPEDLRGRRLLLIHGFTYWAPEARRLLDDGSLNLRIDKAHSHLSAIELLERGRSDFLLDYQPPIEEALSQSGRRPLEGITLHSLPVSLLFSAHSPRVGSLQARLEQAYAELKASGELADWQRRMHLRTTEQP